MAFFRGFINQYLGCPYLLDTYNSILLLTVNGKSIGRAMYEMQLQFGSEWSGFTPDINKPTDTPLERAIKRVIKGMIQTQPADRMSMAEVVSRLAELRSKYNPHVESQDVSSGRNIRSAESRGNGFVVTIIIVHQERHGPTHVDSIDLIQWVFKKMMTHKL